MFELRDPVSSASHLLTAAWAIFAALLMLRLTPSGRKVPVAVFGFSMVFLYLASGLFHGLHFATPEERQFYQRLDHTGVYLLIAGTYTPILSILLTGGWRQWLLRMIWLFALVGIAVMWLFPKPHHALNVGLYMGMGWLGIIAVPFYYRAVGWRAMNWAVLGAALYTAGAIFELTQWPIIVPGLIQYHEVFHFCDTAATLAFFMFVVRHVITYQPQLASARSLSLAAIPERERSSSTAPCRDHGLANLAKK